MNEDMKNTLDHAYEVLGIKPSDLRRFVDQQEAENFLREKSKEKAEDIENNLELNSKAKTNMLKELQACYTIILINDREKNNISTDTIREVPRRRAENYAKIYQEKKAKTRIELADKLIRNMFSSAGGVIPALQGPRGPQNSPTKLSFVNLSSDEMKSLLNDTFERDKLLKTCERHPERISEIRRNIQFLTELANKTPEQRVEICNNYIEKQNKAKNFEPPKSERPKNRFGGWLKKMWNKITRRNTETNSTGRAR